MRNQPLKFPSETPGRVVGFVFLSLIPLVTLVPDSPVPVWLTQDWVLRWSSLFLFFLCGWGYLAQKMGSVEISFDFLDTVLLALTAWVLISVKNSQEAFESFYAFRSFLALVLLWFFLRILWKRWPGVYPAFEKTLLWTSIVSSLWIILSTLGHRPSFSFFANIVPHQGFFPNSNIAAGFLAMVLIWGSSRKLHQDPSSLWALGTVFAGWCCTESRASLIALLFVVVLYLLLHIGEVERKLSSLSPAQWAVGGAVVLGILILLAPSVDRLFRAGEMDSRAFNRYDLWLSCLRMVRDQPLLGFGPGVFSDAFSAYKPALFWNAGTSFAHCEYLQVAVDCGLGAFGLVLVFLWGLLRETGARVRAAGFLKTVSPVAGALECAFYLLIYEAIHNCVDFTFHEWSHRLVLTAFVTYGLSGVKGPDGLRMVFRFTRRFYLTTAAVLVLLLLWALGVGGLRDYLARIWDYKSSSLEIAGKWEEAETLEKQALRLRPQFSNPWNLLGALEDARASEETDPRERERRFSTAADDFERAASLSPYSLVPQENQILNLVARHRLSQALDLEKKLIERAPNYPNYYVNMGDILMKMGRPRDALPLAQKSIDLVYYFLPAYFLKSQSLEALGKKDQALRALEDARDMLHGMGMEDPSRQLEPNILRLEKKK